jgi:DNA mismatch repair protein MutS2
LQAAEIFENLKRAGVSQQALDEARTQFKAVQEIGAEVAEKYKAPARKAPEQDADGLVKGASVKVEGYSQVGVLLDDPKGKSVLVQMGPIRLTIPTHILSAITSAQAKAAPTKKPRSNSGVQLQKTQMATTEMSIRGMRAEEANLDLQRFLDEAILGNLHQVRIVHGKGEGILRKIVHDFLRRHRDVESYRLGEPSEGGDGVTIAVLR